MTILRSNVFRRIDLIATLRIRNFLHEDCNSSMESRFTDHRLSKRNSLLSTVWSINQTPVLMFLQGSEIYFASTSISLDTLYSQNIIPQINKYIYPSIRSHIRSSSILREFQKFSISQIFQSTQIPISLAKHQIIQAFKLLNHWIQLW